MNFILFISGVICFCIVIGIIKPYLKKKPKKKIVNKKPPKQTHPNVIIHMNIGER